MSTHTRHTDKQAQDEWARTVRASTQRSAEGHIDDGMYYKLDETEFEFFSASTGIKDPEELRKHILDVQAEAYEVRTEQQLERCSVSVCS